jgi:alpha-glucosidase
MMTESYSSPDVIKKYYGDATNNGSHLPFNFELISKLKKDSKANDIVKIIDDWYTITTGQITNWAVRN